MTGTYPGLNPPKNWSNPPKKLSKHEKKKK